MRWIEDRREFGKLVRTAESVHEAIRAKTWVTPVVFDDAVLSTTSFASMLKELMRRSEDAACEYAVLDPDPLAYFYQHFKRYPAVEYRQSDTPQSFLEVLNKDPGDSPADAIGINCDAWVVVPGSELWFIHAVRSADDTGGHLWMPSQWNEEVIKSYPFLRVE